MTDTIFGQIARGDVEADVVFEDDRAVAFRDLNPQAPVHVLVIPRDSLVSLADAPASDPALLGHLLQVSPRKKGWPRMATASSPTSARTAAKPCSISTSTCWAVGR